MRVCAGVPRFCGEPGRAARRAPDWPSVPRGVKRGSLTAGVGVGELSVLVHRAGQEALAERAVRHEADAQLLAGLQHPFFSDPRVHSEYLF